MIEGRFREVCADYLGSFLERIEASVARLSEEQVWWRPNGSSNSVGNLMLHLQGNLSQWILASLGGAAYERHRSEEFAADRTAGREALLAGIRRVTAEAQKVIRELPDGVLLLPVQIQSYDSDGIHAVVHVVEHMSYHTGQIVQIAKQLLGPESRIEFFPQHRRE
jgi:uncharacterized damage-inducible protein DinB